MKEVFEIYTYVHEDFLRDNFLLFFSTCKTLNTCLLKNSNNLLRIVMLYLQLFIFKCIFHKCNQCYELEAFCLKKRTQ